MRYVGDYGITDAAVRIEDTIRPSCSSPRPVEAMLVTRYDYVIQNYPCCLYFFIIAISEIRDHVI